jgi:hypothetical protein
MSETVTTKVALDLIDRVRASFIGVLSGHFLLNQAAIERCVRGYGPDIRISSRRGLVVVARIQKEYGVDRLIDIKQMAPEQLTSVRSVLALVLSKLEEQ